MLSLSREALQSHLFRLLIAGLVSVALGSIVLLVRPVWRPFGLMTFLWGAIDGAIAFASRSGAVQNARAILPMVELNEGLNFCYVLVGLLMMRFAGDRKTIAQFGFAVAIQGMILLVLDGKLWFDLQQASLFR